MNEQRFYQVAAYHATMSYVRKLLSDGVISNAEFNRIEQHFKEKYDLINTAIYQ